MTGLAGGLVSSTAVTLTFARQSREEGDGSDAALASGLLLAWGIMFVRVIVEVAVVHAPLVAPLLLPMGAMGLVTLVLAGLFAARSRSEQRSGPGEVVLRNPFSLASAAKFALFFAVVLVAVKLTQLYFPGGATTWSPPSPGSPTSTPSPSPWPGSCATAGPIPRTGVAAIVVAALTNTVVEVRDDRGARRPRAAPPGARGDGAPPRRRPRRRS